ncbi:hypothetical protein [Kineococcus rubinsiae]|uniref:hypothetical protein n=1 Tax=Kineococcus rubinsiae TaxID=2609562 RepID=UPI0014301646|nr:hypothetical protein [Kineococcus rubinsiae]NIZ92205.1 hypothetical protein [Kineococcus rubinsiae]
MSTATARARRRDPLLPALVALPAVGAVTTLVVSARLTSWDLVTADAGAVLFTLVFAVWALLPFALAVAVGVSVHRHWRGGVPAALAGGLLLTALTGWLLWSVVTSESSTASLGLLFAPFLQAALAGLTMAASVGLAALRRRRADRRG